jgi:putative restriction endonuclease
MARPIIFGEIQGIEEGQWFEGRKEMMETSFHRNWGAGIDGNGKDGTSAIVLSGGYEDDDDHGDEIIYTGAGGNDPATGKQIEDQIWTNRGNAGLLVSMDHGLPVRVIRGYMHQSELSPGKGYKYAGLYSVVDAWQERGKSGFMICRFRLEYSGGKEDRKTPQQIELDYGRRESIRKSSTVIRIVRDTKIANDVKRYYDYECQVCQTFIPTKIGRYAEGAHIKPLGKPHNGEDNTDNIICLCPNHHVMFDRGAFSISDGLNLLGNLSGRLLIRDGHKLNKENLSYHRTSHGYA